MGQLVIHGNLKLNTVVPSGTGDNVLTADPTTGDLGQIGTIDTSTYIPKALTSAYILVGNGSNVATGVAVSGDITMSNAGVVGIASGVIVNDDVNASAAIALSKLAATTASRALVSDSSGFVSASAVTATELGYVSGVTSAIQTQLNTKVATATLTTNGDILFRDGTGTVTRLPVGTNGYVLGVTAGIPTWEAKQPVPNGGTTNQYLAKNSNTDGDVAWVTLTAAKITDVTATAAELNITDGLTATTTELNYSSGVTSAIQTQIDSKQAAITGAASTVVSSNLTASRAAISNGSGKLDVSTTTDTELGYVSGVTSPIQGQIDAKQNATLTQNAIWVGNTSNVPTALAAGTAGQVLTISAGAPTWVTPGTGGTVTSVQVSGGTTGMSFSGGPITTTGTMTMTGTLAVANGGTNITSYAVGDLIQATGATTLSKLASVSAGSYLRSGGITTASAWSTVKLPDTMSALGLWVANSANTTINLTATAGQSIRVNAGGTAWEAYTPSGTTYTFTNGLTESGGTVSLGGAITSGGYATIGTEGGGQVYMTFSDAVGLGNKTISMGVNRFTSFSKLFISENIQQLAYNNGLGADYDFTQSALGSVFSVGGSTRLKFDGANTILNLGSDATGDTYYRNSSGYFTRLPVGTNGHVLTLSGGLPSWAAPSGGGLTIGTTTITSGTNTRVLYNNSGVVGEYTVSGSGNVAMTTSPTFTTPNIGTATGTASGNWSLASGGTFTGTNTLTMSTNPLILSSGVTTGTGATAGIQNVFNSLTTGNGLDISSSSVSSGSIVKITGTGTAAASNTQSGLVVDVSGANTTSTQTTYGGYFSNTKTGTSSTNIAGYFNASGGTNNLAIYAPSGIVTLGSTGAGYNGRIYSTAGTGGRVALFGSFEITTSGGPGWSGTGIQVVGSNRKLSFYGGNWGTDNDQIDVSWNATSVNRSGVDLGIFRSSLGSFNSATFQANSIAGFRFIDTWPTLTTPLNVVYGFDYNSGGAGNAVSEVAIRATRGQVVLGATGTSSANDRVKINGIGTTTGKGLVVNNSSGTERFSVQDDGVINVSGSGGTAGQVLVSNGTSAAAWGTPTVNITGSNQRYQTQVVNISSSLVASGTGFASLSNPSEYANKTVLSVDFVIAMIKNDGTAVVYGKLTSIFRKDNSGTWTADVPGTPTISDITQLSGFVGDINGGVPGITWTTPGTTSGTWQLGCTAAISSTTN